MASHRLKTHPEPFSRLWDRSKRHEVRVDDRDFAVDDILELEEWNPLTEEYSGRIVFALVTYITKGGSHGLPPELCVMSIHERARTARRSSSIRMSAVEVSTCRCGHTELLHGRDQRAEGHPCALCECPEFHRVLTTTPGSGLP